MSCQMKVMYGFSRDPVPLVSAPMRKPYPGEIERMKRELDHLLDEQGKQKQVRFQQNRIDDDGDEETNEKGHNEVANGAESDIGGEMSRNDDIMQEEESKDTGTPDDEADTENEDGNNDDGEGKKAGAQKEYRNKDVVDLNATELPTEHVEQWREMFEEMCEYKRFTGNCVVPTKFDHRLSKWVSEQRQRYKMMNISRYRQEYKSYLFTLSQEEESLLRSIGFVFDASQFKGRKRDPDQESKQKEFLRYMKSKMKKGKTADDVSDDEDTTDSKVTFRSADGANDNEEIGPDNGPRDGSDDDRDGGSDEEMSEAQSRNFKAWYEMYEELCQYKSENGDCRVSKHYHGNQSRHLGFWVSGQRKRFRAKKMSKKEVSLLDGIGFIWASRKYNDKLRMAENTANNNDAAEVSSDNDIFYDAADSKIDSNSGDEGVEDDNESLGTAPGDDGNIGNDGESSETQSRPFKSWYEMYEELCQYKSENGDCRVPFSYHGNQERRLGYWVAGQRKRYKSKKMSEKQSSLLNDIGFIWETR